MLQYFETIIISFISIILMLKILKQFLVIGKIKHENRRLKNKSKVLKWSKCSCFIMDKHNMVLDYKMYFDRNKICLYEDLG